MLPSATLLLKLIIGAAAVPVTDVLCAIPFIDRNAYSPTSAGVAPDDLIKANQSPSFCSNHSLFIKPWFGKSVSTVALQEASDSKLIVLKNGKIVASLAKERVQSIQEGLGSIRELILKNNQFLWPRT